MKTTPNPNPPQAGDLLPRVFAISFGAFLGLALLKFGNPPLMEKYVVPPGDFWEFLLGTPWPIRWAYGLLAAITVLGLLTARWTSRAPRPEGRASSPAGLRSPLPFWLLAAPLAWLLWQILAATHTLDRQITGPTLAHFTACVVCFYLGFFALSPVRRPAGFWWALSAAFLLVLAIGWEQHFGGLEQTRQYFFRQIYPHLKEVSAEYLKKMTSNRIFSTLFYPNALAGAVLLLLPTVLASIAQARESFTVAARGFLMAVVGIAALASLYWSGSKGGWLLMLAIGLLALLRLPFARSWKIAVVMAMLLAGLMGFFCKYSGFFQKGATSVGARFDYWRAALQTAAAHPVLGTGPGTFSIPYARIKRPESEMARLAHNDYLEQASDSGIPGFVGYTVLIVGALVYGAPSLLRASVRARKSISPDDAAQEKLKAAAGYAARGRSGVSTALTEAKVENSGASLAVASGLPNAATEKKVTSIAAVQLQDLHCFCVWLGVLGWALQGLLEFGLYIPALAWPAFAFMGFLLGRSGR